MPDKVVENFYRISKLRISAVPCSWLLEQKQCRTVGSFLESSSFLLALCSHGIGVAVSYRDGA